GRPHLGPVRSGRLRHRLQRHRRRDQQPPQGRLHQPEPTGHQHQRLRRGLADERCRRGGPVRQRGDRAPGRRMRARPAAETVDRTDGAANTGTLVLTACNVRRANPLERIGPFTPPKSAPVLPLVAVDGRPVRLGAGLRVTVALAAGPHLVEVMDDHHYESRTVTVDDGGTARLWFGVGLLRSEPRLHLGSKEYAARSTAVDRRAEQIGAVTSLLVGVAGLTLLYP